jgi:hypothetical protein
MKTKSSDPSEQQYSRYDRYDQAENADDDHPHQVPAATAVAIGAPFRSAIIFNRRIRQLLLQERMYSPFSGVGIGYFGVRRRMPRPGSVCAFLIVAMRIETARGLFLYLAATSA